MDRTEIDALAQGLVPFVRDSVSEAVTPLAARIVKLEARPPEKGETGAQGESGPQGPPGPKGDSGELAMLSPEIAEQVANAVRLLHESPEIVTEIAIPQRQAKVARIERDEQGNFVPIYDR